MSEIRLNNQGEYNDSDKLSDFVRWQANLAAPNDWYAAVPYVSAQTVGYG